MKLTLILCFVMDDSWFGDKEIKDHEPILTHKYHSLPSTSLTCAVIMN